MTEATWKRAWSHTRSTGQSSRNCWRRPPFRPLPEDVAPAVASREATKARLFAAGSPYVLSAGRRVGVAGWSFDEIRYELHDRFTLVKVLNSSFVDEAKQVIVPHLLLLLGVPFSESRNGSPILLHRVRDGAGRTDEGGEQGTKGWDSSRRLQLAQKGLSILQLSA